MSRKAHKGASCPSTPRSPSWVDERNPLRRFGDRKTRAILAIYHARRSARQTEFFVHPDIARANGLKPAQLTWALDKLEGQLIETVNSKHGRYRTIRLLPEFEQGTAVTKDPHPSPGEERVDVNVEEVLAGLKQLPPDPLDFLFP